MKKQVLTIFAIVLAAFLLHSCGNSADEGRAVPRRYAYARIEPYDTVRTEHSAGPVQLSINKGADVSHPDGKPEWLDASFGRYGATLHLSTIMTEDIDVALANRRERISLNLGGAKARSDVFDNGLGMRCEIVVSRDPSATPVQFVAYGDGVLVSGAFVIAGSTEPADSLRPICTELEKEAFAIVNSIHPRNEI